MEFRKRCLWRQASLPKTSHDVKFLQRSWNRYNKISINCKCFILFGDMLPSQKSDHESEVSRGLSKIKFYDPYSMGIFKTLYLSASKRIVQDIRDVIFSRSKQNSLNPHPCWEVFKIITRRMFNRTRPEVPFNLTVFLSSTSNQT